MAYDRSKITVCRCPECFQKEIDIGLEYDEKEDIYYCLKCCFEGTPDYIEEVFNNFKQAKYRDMCKTYPFKG